MSKISVTTIAGLTSGGDANIVKIESGDALNVVSGDLTVDTSTLKVDSSNNRVGIGTASPAHPLTITASGATSTFSVNPSSNLTVIGTSQSSATNSDLYIDTKGTGSHIFRYNGGGAEIARFTSGGLAIGGTGAANTLDDYEEGTWTPTVTAGGSSMTYSVQHGNYTKIGDICYAIFYLHCSGGTMASSVLKIGPLPFTSASNHYTVASGYNNASSGSVTRPQPILFPGDTNIWFYEQGGNGVSQVTGSTFGNNLSQLWNITYRVA